MHITQSAVQEGIANYTISLAEIVQALGVFGVIGFLFLWGLKFFKLLPTEAIIYDQIGMIKRSEYKKRRRDIKSRRFNPNKRKKTNEPAQNNNNQGFWHC